MIIAIASGKGGTGKTMVATSLALAIGDGAQLVDCDVEEPNDHIFLRPTIEHREAVTIPVPDVNERRCTFCGLCADVCAFNAIAVLKERVLVFPELCHGCGACCYLCPEGAITEREREVGVVEVGRAGAVDFVAGSLNLGEAMATPVIREVKRHIDRRKTVIVDVAPGTSCPVVEAVRGSDLCLLVTEPTPFGLNDLDLAVQMVRKLNVPHAVVINRAGIAGDMVEDYCSREGIPVLLHIPFSASIARLYSTGVALVEGMPEWRPLFNKLLEDVREQAEREYSGRRAS